LRAGSSTGAAKLMGFEKGNKYRFKPGESGNPSGRPKGKTFEESIRDILGEEVEGAGGESVSKLEILSRVVMDKAIRDRDISTISLLAKRLWPEVRQHEVSGSVDLHKQIEDAAQELDRILGINGNGEQASGDDEPPIQ